MKKLLLASYFILFFSFHSFAQLEKGTWLVGGNGSLSSTKNTFNSEYIVPYGGTVYQNTDFKMQPNIGYFLSNKFVAGLKLSMDWQTSKGLSAGTFSSSNDFRVNYGPFLRYYFLEKNKSFNLLLDASYQLGNVKLSDYKGSRSNFSINTGSSIFFNSSVAIEFLIGYRYETEKVNEATYSFISNTKGIQFGIGFQIHLNKN